MKHRWIPLTTVLGSVLIMCSATVGCVRKTQETAAATNVVLVSFDGVRADHLKIYGYNRPTGLNLRTMAKDSVVFDMAIAQSSSTIPSHRSLMTSRYPSMTGRFSVPLAQVLKDNGYSTAAFTGLDLDPENSDIGEGFDHLAQTKQIDQLAFPTKNLADAVPDLLTWIEKNKNDPFFVFLHGEDTSSPYGPPPGSSYQMLFCGSYRGRLFGHRAGDLLESIRQAESTGETAAAPVVNARDRQQIIALYDGGIFYADRYLQIIRKTLKDLGLWDRTIVVVLSDHGEELWDHGSVLHSHTLFQELIRVPLLIRFPGGRNGGQRITEPVGLIDVAPTIIEALGLPPVSTHQGRSLVGRINGEPVPRMTTLASEVGSLRAFLRWPTKAIVNRETGEVEVYDLDKDPGERKRIARNKNRQNLLLAREMALQIPKFGTLAARQIDEIIDSLEVQKIADEDD